MEREWPYRKWQPPAESTPSKRTWQVPSEFNGEAFQPDFENWKPISFTDRGDNNSVRIILGNEIAVKAARVRRSLTVARRYPLCQDSLAESRRS